MPNPALCHPTGNMARSPVAIMCFGVSTRFLGLHPGVSAATRAIGICWVSAKAFAPHGVAAVVAFEMRLRGDETLCSLDSKRLCATLEVDV